MSAQEPVRERLARDIVAGQGLDWDCLPYDSGSPDIDRKEALKLADALIAAGVAYRSDVREEAARTSWLIERGREWWVAGPYSRDQRQNALDDSGMAPWTSDVNKALRFARKSDAETVIRYEGLSGARATEHIWLDASALRSRSDV